MIVKETMPRHRKAVQQFLKLCGTTWNAECLSRDVTLLCLTMHRLLQLMPSELEHLSIQAGHAFPLSAHRLEAHESTSNVGQKR